MPHAVDADLWRLLPPTHHPVLPIREATGQAGKFSLFRFPLSPSFSILDMSRPPRAVQKNRPEQPTQGSDWTYDFRSSHPSFDSDSDSDSHPEASLSSTTEHLTDDAKLLQELDLTSRQDTAQYKPNPWSIAKVNAASRPSKPMKTTTGRKDEKVDAGAGGGKKKELKGTIVDFLRKQTSDKPQVKKTEPKPPSLIPPSQNQTSSRQKPDGAPSAIGALERSFSNAYSHTRHDTQPSLRNHPSLAHTVNTTLRDSHFTTDTTPSFDRSVLKKVAIQLSPHLSDLSSPTGFEHDSLLDGNANISSDTTASSFSHASHNNPDLEPAPVLTNNHHFDDSDFPVQPTTLRDSHHVPLFEVTSAHLDTDATHAHTHSPPLPDLDIDCVPHLGPAHTHISAHSSPGPALRSRSPTILAEHVASSHSPSNEAHIPTPLSFGAHHHPRSHANDVFYSSPPRTTSSHTPFYVHKHTPSSRLCPGPAGLPGPPPRRYERPSMIRSFSSPRPLVAGATSEFSARFPRNAFPMRSPNATDVIASSRRPAYVHERHALFRPSPGPTSACSAESLGSIRFQAPHPDSGRMNGLMVEGMPPTFGFKHVGVTRITVGLTEHLLSSPFARRCRHST